MDPEKLLCTVELDPDLAREIELLAEDLDRNFKNTVRTALEWAIWAHACGRSPWSEMMAEPEGFAAWKSKVRAARETRELARLYELS